MVEGQLISMFTLEDVMDMFRDSWTPNISNWPCRNQVSRYHLTETITIGEITWI